MKLKKCRNCQGKKLTKLFSLGKLSYTGKFPKNINTNIKKTELTLVMCNKCSLVQLNNNYNLKYLYGPDYGYRTGINKTMTDHMKNIMKNLTRKIKFKKFIFEGKTYLTPLIEPINVRSLMVLTTELEYEFHK